MDSLKDKKISPNQKTIYIYIQYLKLKKDISTISIAELANDLAIFKSEVSRALRSLEEKNLIYIIRIGRFRKVVIQS